MKKCKCGGEPVYKNGDIQLCSKCLGSIWVGKITLDEYLKKYEEERVKK